jgi:hypothetical protein
VDSESAVRLTTSTFDALGRAKILCRAMLAMIEDRLSPWTAYRTTGGHPRFSGKAESNECAPPATVGAATRFVQGSSLALTIPKEPTELDDGLLTAGEVAQLKLKIDWVVLSA